MPSMRVRFDLSTAPGAPSINASLVAKSKVDGLRSEFCGGDTVEWAKVPTIPPTLTTKHPSLENFSCQEIAQKENNCLG